MSPQESPSALVRPMAGRSPSPPHQPQSKRDKRRTMLSERLADIVSSFSEHHKEQYFAQLSAIQCDINLVMRADPYNGPLDDDSETLTKMVSDVREEVCRSHHIAGDAEESFNALVGRSYASFVDEVNRAMEERDQDLTMTFNNYQNGVEELRRTNQYKLQLAQEEHQLLSKTLRERLIQNLTQRRSKLLRDKEQLDIADSNALLLNPNQFTLGTASPGGAHSNRKTRNTRLRPGDVEDPNTNPVVEGNKRKRKAAAADDEDSPTPLGRMAESSSNPFKDARAKLVNSQYEAPMYTIDRLFTEKELALNMTRANLATSEYFARMRAQGANSANGGSTTNVSGAENTDANDTDAPGATGLGADGGDTGEIDTPVRAGSPALGSLLPNSSSQTFHATRSSQRANPLSDLANAATSLGPFAVSLSATVSKSNPAAPTPPGLSESDIANDVALMTRMSNDPVIERMIDKCCEKPGPLGGDLSSLRRGETEGSNGAGAASFNDLAAGASVRGGYNITAALAMARSGSGYAFNVGGVGMSKSNSEDGVTMSRSVSAADFGAASRRI